jgi:hypothetical protein
MVPPQVIRGYWETVAKSDAGAGEDGALANIGQSPLSHTLKNTTLDTPAGNFRIKRKQTSEDKTTSLPLWRILNSHLQRP